MRRLVGAEVTVFRPVQNARYVGRVDAVRTGFLRKEARLAYTQTGTSPADMLPASGNLILQADDIVVSKEGILYLK